LFGYEEKEMFSNVAKAFFSQERKTLKKLQAIEQKLQRKISKGSPAQMKQRITQVYQARVEQNMKTNLFRVLITIDARFLHLKEPPTEEDMNYDEKRKVETAFHLERVLCHRLKGDLYRYLAELGIDYQANVAAQEALKCYQSA